MKRGKFIVLEGADGSGKTSISKYLCRKLKKIYGENMVVGTFEPTDQPIGNLIREFIGRKRTCTSVDAMTHLFVADRIEHVKSVIQPALRQGKIVVCDRYFISTIVYQSIVDDGAESRKRFKSLIKFFNFLEADLMEKDVILEPDLTLYLCCEVEKLLERVKNRSGNKKDIYEKESFLEKVVFQYENYVNGYSAKNLAIVDANLKLDTAKRNSWNTVNYFFGFEK